jgi:hypothetical protein
VPRWFHNRARAAYRSASDRQVEAESASAVLRQGWAVAAAVLVLAVYSAVLAIMPKGGFWSPDEGAKFIQLRSVSWRGGGASAIAYGGRGLDPDFAFYPNRCYHDDLYPMPAAGGGVKFHWPIWFSLAHRPLFAAFGLTGLYLVPLLSGWLAALLAGHLSSAWDRRLAPWAILLVGLGTPIAFFSLTFWEHTLSVLLGLLALAIVASPRWRRPRTVWLAAPLMLAAAALRIETILFGVALLVAWLGAGALAADIGERAGQTSTGRRRRVLAALAVTAAVIAALLALGLPERHRWMLSALPTYLRDAAGKLPHLAEALTAMFVHTAGNQAPAVSPAVSYAVLAACGVLAVAPLIWSRRAEAIALVLALAIVVEFSVFLIVRPEPYVSLHGLVPIAPLLVLAPYAAASAWRRRRHAQLVILIAAAAYGALIAAVVFVFVFTPDGVMPTGLEWGNRYLFFLYPLGIVLALAGIHEYRRSARDPRAKAFVTTAAVALAACGVLLEVRGVWTLVESRRLVTTWEAALRDGPPVVTDVWWLPAAMAPLFVSHEVQCVRGAADLGDWLPLAGRHGVDTFTFASFRRFEPREIVAHGASLSPIDEQVVAGLRMTRVRIVASAPAAGDAAPAP